MTWLIWALMCFGLTYLVVGASITQWPRRFVFNVLGPKLGGWLACAPCCGFWVGLFVGVPDPAIFVTWLPIEWLDTSLDVSIMRHVAGGIVFMGLTALLQWWTGALFAEIGAEERARKEMSPALAMERFTEEIVKFSNEQAEQGKEPLVVSHEIGLQRRSEEDDEPDGGVGHA